MWFPNQTRPDYELDLLVRELRGLKEAENEARHRRIDVEEKIAAFIPGPETGQKTVKLNDGMSITVKRGFNYKADCAKIAELFEPNNIFGQFAVPIKTKTTRELDEKGYEYYRLREPGVFNKLAEFVVVTPKKVSVEVKVT